VSGRSDIVLYMSETRERQDVIAEASARLDLSEFDLFGQAYRRWFGREPAAGLLEQAFAAYMFHRTVPPWVRHYAREILRTEPADTKATRREGRAVAAAACAAFLLVFALLMSSAPAPAKPRPLSCAGGGPGLVVLENFAYAFAGRERPSC